MFRARDEKKISVALVDGERHESECGVVGKDKRWTDTERKKEKRGNHQTKMRFNKLDKNMTTRNYEAPGGGGGDGGKVL